MTDRLTDTIDAKKAKFMLEFYVVMLGAGRDEEAKLAWAKVHCFLDTLAEAPFDHFVEFDRSKYFDE